jgi:hypothetical protein
MIFFDTETMGFHSPIVLIQWADGVDGQVERHNVWYEPIIDTIALIERLCEEGVVGFNLAFDWFHVCQLYTTLVLLGEKVGFDEHPIDHINTYADLEPEARNGPCVKPRTALDLMLHARKGPYQSTMDRRDIRIKRVPKVLAFPLCEELNKRVQLKDIYFTRQQDKSKRWHVMPIKTGGTKGKPQYDNDFVNIELKFRASSALKVLVADALNLKEDTILKFGDIGVPKKYIPNEVGWAPFARALVPVGYDWWCKIKKGQGIREARAWPGVVERHASHWKHDPKAIRYSELDVTYLQRLFTYFGNPESDDDDSILANMVGASRWRGFSVDTAKLQQLLDKAIIREKSAPKHSEHVRKYLMEVLSPTEQVALKVTESTKKAVLETISRLKIDCPTCSIDGEMSKFNSEVNGIIVDNKIVCPTCNGSGEAKHPAAERAERCLDARKARFDRTLFNKLIQAGRFHASAKVIGSLSGRMSGGDGMNALGVQHLKEVRSAFTLAFDELELCGGDFSSYEIAIMDADYDDENLRRQLLTCYRCKQQRSLIEFDDLFCPRCGAAEDKCTNCKKTCFVFADGRTECSCGHGTGKGSPEVTLRKIHGLFGMCLAPGKTYDDILATKGKDPDLYDQGKRGVFSQGYGGNWQTLVNRLGIDEKDAKIAEVTFATEYKGIGKAKERNDNDFCSMRQPGGIGSQVYWSEPKDYAESLNGFRRYFTLENSICKVLFDLANDPPEEWTKLRIECVRRDRNQKVGGAVRSALFAAAFQIQSHNMRAAQNHRIQSTGALETKRLQCRLWRHQPVGIHKWRLQPFQVHDELMIPARNELKPVIKKDVDDFIKERRCLIPLLKMDFSMNLKSWADK